MSSKWTNKDKNEYQQWLREKEAIERATPEINETATQKSKRIKLLLDHPIKAAKYYFGHLAKSEFAYFHKRDIKKVFADPDIFAMMEYHREGAKSVIYNVIVPMLLKAKGELTGMMLASANESKARVLLSDLQAELMFNQRYINDFGEQVSFGNWKDGYFITSDNIGFWAFGRGQSPRGTRNADKRPNYGTFDDMDDAVLVRNEKRVDEAVDWILGDFFGAMSIHGARLIGLGNRIHKTSIVAKIVGDIEPDDPKREGLYHSKVYALENPKTHKKDLSLKGVPAWKERYTREQIVEKMRKMGNRLALREFFHQHVVIGKVFKEQDLPWAKLDPIHTYDAIVTYNDPSYKKSATSDKKGIVLIGRKGNYFDIFKAYVRQCSTPEMVRAHYTISTFVPDKMACRHYMEANFIQDLMLDEYWRYGSEDNGGELLRIRGDKRQKPDKEVRVENLTPFTEVGLIRFNAAEKDNPDMIELRDQFLGFPDYEWDDGPDAVEGGIYILNKRKVKSKKKTGGATGKYKRNNSRRA